MGEPWVDEREQEDLSVRELRDYLDEYTDTDSEFPYGIPSKTLMKWGRLFDIVTPSSRRTCCFTRGEHVYFQTAVSNVIHMG